MSALQPGEKAGELNGLEWIKGEPIKIFDKEDKKKKIVIVELWATWDKGSKLAFPVLSAIENKYTDSGIVVVGISKEKEDDLKGYLDVYKKTISFRIARDPSGHITDYYSGSDTRIPLLLVVGREGKILWRGHPFELEPVLKKILAGNFNLEKQIKISQLHEKMQGFLQIEDLKQVVKTADKILDLDPSDDIAMRVRLFVFESKKEDRQALEFINTQISKNPQLASLYFIKLDLMERVNVPLKQIHNTVKDIFDKFNNKHETLYQLAWFAVNKMRFGTAPLEIVLAASKRSIELLVDEKEQDPVKLAVYLSTQAKIYYMTGALELAIQNQKKVIRLQKGDPAEQASIQLLKYYKDALKLRNKTK